MRDSLSQIKPAGKVDTTKEIVSMRDSSWIINLMAREQKKDKSLLIAVRTKMAKRSEASYGGKIKMVSFNMKDN